MKHKNIIITAVSVIFIFAFSLFAWFKPADEFSAAERRKLAQMPELSMKAVLSGRFMQDFEKYSQDQFPLRSSFRTVKAYTAMKLFGNLDNNDIYISDGHAVKMEYPLNEASVKRAGERFKYVRDKYLKDTGAKVYLSVIPDKNFFAAQDGRHLRMDYDALTEIIRGEMNFAEYIDIFSTLSLDDYYSTDTHWRQERLIPTAEALAAGMETEISNDFIESTLPREYFGVYYGQAALPMDSDEIHYLENDFISSAAVYDYQNGRESSVYNMEKGMGRDAYELFLSGPVSLIEMENTLSNTGRELIIFRDSFGSSLAPLLLSAYDKITLVDIRYMHPDMLGKFIEFNNQDVLFLYSTSVLNSSEVIK